MSETSESERLKVILLCCNLQQFSSIILTTRHAAWHIILVVSICLSVCLSLCQTITFEGLNAGS